MNTILSAWTVIVFVLFIGISWWAWSSRKKEDFEAAAMIPFDEEDEPCASDGGTNHG